jgi:hypothetical protein
MQQMKGWLTTATQRLRAVAIAVWARLQAWYATARAGTAVLLARIGARTGGLRERVGALRLPLPRREPREPKGLLGDGTTPLSRFAPPRRTRPTGA